VKLFFGNLRDMSEREFADLLQPYGCSDVKIICDRSGQSRGFGYAQIEDATRWVLDFEGQFYNNRRLHCEPARERRRSGQAG
jgi:RNA recognition motif. (a.k.a. RRM, RBD, or RNP domain)